MKKSYGNILIFFIVCINLFQYLISCSNSSNIQTDECVRIYFSSPYNDKVEAKVYIEGADGNIVNGALVTVRDSLNTVNILDYNFQQGCYYKLIEKPSKEGYILTVKSHILDSVREYTVPHIFLNDSIDYKSIEMVNKIGQSFQKYDSFNTEYPIRVTWYSSVDNCIYKVTIKTPLKTLYESTTNNKTIEIPANTIPAGTSYVYLQIQEQKSFGDMFYETANYYSVSVYSTGNISFNVQ